MTSGWDTMARSRDASMGENGDLWHRSLIDPTLLRVVGPVAGLRVVEVACGNGYLARRFARSGARSVLALDASAPSIRFARARERAAPTGARFTVGKATRVPSPDGSADLVVANMALMDIGDARGAIREVARLLAPGGRFVFSISHPCFDLDERTIWLLERGYDAHGVYGTTVWRKVRGYRREGRTRIPWPSGQGGTVWTEAFHRTLSTYSRYLRSAGLAIARMEEPEPLPEMLEQSPQGAYIAEIPLHLVVEAVGRGPVTRGSRTLEHNPPGVVRRSGSRGRTRGSGSPRRGSRPGL